MNARLWHRGSGVGGDRWGGGAVDPARPVGRKRTAGSILTVLVGLVAGCGDIFPPGQAPLFAVPLTIDGQPVGDAIIDTGGAYEVLLRETFGLRVIDTVDVLVFGGYEQVDLTEGFSYAVGGFQTEANGAIVGISSCDCNGLGIGFFRQTGAVLGLRFSDPGAVFLATVPEEGTRLAFAPPPPGLTTFQGAFIEVEVTADGDRRALLGLLDTGTSDTLLRRGLVGDPGPAWLNWDRVTVKNGELGTITLNAALFDTPGLPDMILGTDLMRAWGDRWYFSFTPTGGTVTVVPANEPSTRSVPTVPTLRIRADGRCR